MHGTAITLENMSQVSGFTAVHRKTVIVQGERANPIQRKWHHQKRMSKEAGVKDEKFQEIIRDGRSARFPAYRAFPLLYSLSPCETSVARLARALHVQTQVEKHTEEPFFLRSLSFHLYFYMKFLYAFLC